MSSADSDKGGRPSVAVATWIAATMIAQQVASKATRDAFYLSQHDPRALATVMAVTAGLALVAAWGLSRMLTRLSPARVTPGLFVGNGLLFIADWGLGTFAPEEAATLTYVHVGVVGGVAVSAFWSLVNERFDPHTAKKYIGRIGTGATAGGAFGGLLAWSVARVSDVTTTLLLLGAANFACAALIGRLGRGGPVARREASAASFLDVLRGTPYLWYLGGLIALAELGDTLVEYAFKARAASDTPGSVELAALFSLFYAGTSVLVFCVQALLTQPILERFGLARTAASLPGATLIGAALSLVMPGFWSAALLRAATTTAEHSLFRSAYELSYTPLAPEKKRPTKTLIDVGSGKLAGTIGSGLLMVLVATLAQGVALRVAMLVLLGTGGVALAVALRLGLGYKKALTDALRSGALLLRPDELVDATTRTTYAETMALDRDKLLAQIDAWKQHEAVEAPPEPRPSDTSEDPLLSAKRDLESKNPRRARSVLSRFDPLPAELVPSAIPLLGVDEILSEALVALRDVADEHVDLLTQALLDPRTPFVVRRRLPRVLRGSSRQSAVDALIDALSDARFEVRYRCAIALLRIVNKHPELRVDEAAILSAVRRETEVGRATWLAEGIADVASTEDASPLESVLTGPRPTHAVTHAFTLLATVLDPEPLLLAYVALSSEDPKLRGTGFEYLDLVLPPDIRERLWPYLSESPQDVRTRASRAELVERLRSSKDSLTLDGAALRKLLGR